MPDSNNEHIVVKWNHWQKTDANLKETWPTERVTVIFKTFFLDKPLRLIPIKPYHIHLKELNELQPQLSCCSPQRGWRSVRYFEIDTTTTCNEKRNEGIWITLTLYNTSMGEIVKGCLRLLTWHRGLFMILTKEHSYPKLHIWVHKTRDDQHN